MALGEGWGRLLAGRFAGDDEASDGLISLGPPLSCPPLPLSRSQVQWRSWRYCGREDHGGKSQFYPRGAGEEDGARLACLSLIPSLLTFLEAH